MTLSKSEILYLFSKYIQSKEVKHNVIMTSSKRQRISNAHHHKKKDWLNDRKLQDSVVRIANHLVAFVVNGGGLIWDVLYLSVDGESVFEYGGYGGKFKHLTFWNQVYTACENALFGVYMYRCKTACGENLSNFFCPVSGYMRFLC